MQYFFPHTALVADPLYITPACILNIFIYDELPTICFRVKLYYCMFMFTLAIYQRTIITLNMKHC